MYFPVSHFPLGSFSCFILPLSGLFLLISDFVNRHGEIWLKQSGKMRYHKIHDKEN